MKRKKSKTSMSRKIFLLCNYLLMLLITFICIYPFWYIIIYSFSEPGLVDVNPPVFLPRGFSFSNYRDIFELQGFFHALLISVLRTVLGTAGAVLSCSFLGYLFTKNEMPARKWVYRFLILTMYVNGGMISTFIVIKSYGLLNNFWVYILPMLISAYNIVLIKTYVEQLPQSLEESARLDGAGYVRVFTAIILPLSKPIIATVAVFVAVGQWNSFQDTLLLMTNEKLFTLQFILYRYINQASSLSALIKNTSSTQMLQSLATAQTATSVRMTVSVIVVIPILCVYPFFQKYIVKGVMIGSVKG